MLVVATIRVTWSDAHACIVVGGVQSGASQTRVLAWSSGSEDGKSSASDVQARAALSRQALLEDFDVLDTSTSKRVPFLIEKVSLQVDCVTKPHDGSIVDLKTGPS